MRILVTGGAGFIGSHTCDRLVELGHEVTVLDALTAPVHRDGRPSYLTPGVELYVGDVRNRACPPTCCAVPTRSTTSRRTRTTCPTSRASWTSTSSPPLSSTRSQWPSASTSSGSSWRRPSRPWGRACTGAPSTVSRHPGCGRSPRWRPRAGRSPARAAVASGDGADARADLEPAERLRHVEVRGGDAGDQPGSSLRHPHGGPAVQHRPGSASVGLQRLLRGVPDLLPALRPGGAPTVYEDGGAIRDYVNIEDVVDANALVLTHEDAVGRVLNVGEGASTPPAISPRSPARPTARTCLLASPGSTASATPATSSPTPAPSRAWAGGPGTPRWSPSRRTPSG